MQISLLKSKGAISPNMRRFLDKTPTLAILLRPPAYALRATAWLTPVRQSAEALAQEDRRRNARISKASKSAGCRDEAPPERRRAGGNL